MKLNGKVAVVTGGSGGYGKGTAEVLKENGVKVWIISRNENNLKKTAGEIGVNYIAGDITVPDDWDRIIKKITEQEGKIDILINNAGGGGAVKPLVEQTAKEVEESININLTGHIFGIMKVSKLMINQKSGLIINISSICADNAWPTWSVYSAAKAGIEQLTKSLHNEFRVHNVHITTLTPSWGATGFSAAAGLPENPEKKVIQPREMGDLIAKICLIPDHLVITKIRIQPMVQEISPM